MNTETSSWMIFLNSNYGQCQKNIKKKEFELELEYKVLSSMQYNQITLKLFTQRVKC